jgi:hypothetical protein
MFGLMIKFTNSFKSNCIDLLYVDDKRALPKEEQFISKPTGSEIETVGISGLIL